MDDLISRAAIEWHTFLVDDGNGMYHEEKVAYKSQIDTLPSAQSKNTDCIYCHEDSDGYVKPIEKNGHAFIRFGMNGWEISLGAKGWNGSAKIMYCPVCGRRFGDG